MPRVKSLLCSEFKLPANADLQLGFFHPAVEIWTEPLTSTLPSPREPLEEEPAHGKPAYLSHSLQGNTYSNRWKVLTLNTFKMTCGNVHFCTDVTRRVQYWSLTWHHCNEHITLLAFHRWLSVHSNVFLLLNCHSLTTYNRSTLPNYKCSSGHSSLQNYLSRKSYLKIISPVEEFQDDPTVQGHLPSRHDSLTQCIEQNH